MAGVRTFEDLKAWQQARKLVAGVRAATCSEKLRRDHSFTDQIRRAARSVMSNLAEGFESNSRAEFNRYLGMARGSCAEVRSQLYEAKDAELLDPNSQERLMELAQSTAKLVSSLKISVERKLSPKSRKAPVDTP